MGHSEGSPEREIHRDAGLPKKDRNISNKNLTLHLQELEEQQQRKPRVNGRKEIIKIKAELNDIETKRTIRKIDNPGAGSLKKKNKLSKPLT